MIGNFLVFGKLLCWLDSSSNRIWLCCCCHHHNPPPLDYHGWEARQPVTVHCFLQAFSFCFYSGFNFVTYKEPKCWTRVLWWSSLGFVGHWWSWQWPTMSTGKLWERWFSTARMDPTRFIWTFKRERCQHITSGHYSVFHIGKQSADVCKPNWVFRIRMTLLKYGTCQDVAMVCQYLVGVFCTFQKSFLILETSSKQWSFVGTEAIFRWCRAEAAVLSGLKQL